MYQLSAIFAVAILSLSLACSDKESQQTTGSDTPVKAHKGVAASAKAGALPSETEVIALDQGKSKVPATIEAPKGSTTFNDSPTAIRVQFEEGEDFWVDVKAGNEFNLDLVDLEKQLLENKYGSVNITLEKSEGLHMWKATTDGHESVKFHHIVDLADAKWVCMTGPYGGYSRAQADRMLQACKTLKATGSSEVGTTSGKLANLSVDAIKAAAKKAGYKVKKVRELPVQLGIKTTVINLNKTTAITLSTYPPESPYNQPSNEPAISSELREGDFAIVVRSPEGQETNRKLLLDALQEAANSK